MKQHSCILQLGSDCWKTWLDSAPSASCYLRASWFLFWRTRYCEVLLPLKLGNSILIWHVQEGFLVVM